MARADGRVQPGQKLTTAFSARAWNRAQDAADIVLGDRASVVGGEQPAGPLPYTFVYAVNTTEHQVPRWGVLSINGIESNPASGPQFEQMPVMRGEAPTGGSASWAVAVEPIGPSGVGRVAIGGAVQCKVVVVDENHRFVKPQTSATGSSAVERLETSAAGEATIVWRQTEAENPSPGRWALVRLGAGGGEVTKWGRVTGPWEKNITKTVVQLDQGGSSIPATPTGQTTFEAVNRFADITRPDEFKVAAVLVDGRWMIVAAEC